jgi:hypothetical protein
VQFSFTGFLTPHDVKLNVRWSVQKCTREVSLYMKFIERYSMRIRTHTILRKQILLKIIRDGQKIHGQCHPPFYNQNGTYTDRLRDHVPKHEKYKLCMCVFADVVTVLLLLVTEWLEWALIC